MMMQRMSWLNTADTIRALLELYLRLDIAPSCFILLQLVNYARFDLST
jgi:hypothetical protein